MASKKHYHPKDYEYAVRKGNREAERDIYGDGFKARTKTHKTGKKDGKYPIEIPNEDEDLY